MVTVENIIEFLKDRSGEKIITPETEITNNIGLFGDDWHEMIQEYSKRYDVDLSKYLWYFHSEEEGETSSIGSAFFKPPYERVKRIPITPLMLTDFANKGSWEIEYPEHKLPKYRYDLLINTILVSSLFCALVIISLRKCI